MRQARRRLRKGSHGLGWSLQGMSSAGFGQGRGPGAAGMGKMRGAAGQGSASQAWHCASWLGELERAGQGRIWRGAHRHGPAKNGSVGQVLARPARRGRKWLEQVRTGLGRPARRIELWQGSSCIGMAQRVAQGQGRRGTQERGSTWTGWDRIGAAGQGVARHGRQGKH